MIDAQAVEELFRNCLFKDEELPPAKYLEARGISVHVGFHPGRLMASKGQIRDWLFQLPPTFQKSRGGGMSFLQACEDKDGVQWTGLHERMDQLFMLGLACGLVSECMPREMWPVLPGGMPYYMVDDSPTAI